MKKESKKQQIENAIASYNELGIVKMVKLLNKKGVLPNGLSVVLNLDEAEYAKKVIGIAKKEKVAVCGVVKIVDKKLLPQYLPDIAILIPFNDLFGRPNCKISMFGNSVVNVFDTRSSSFVDMKVDEISNQIKDWFDTLKSYAKKASYDTDGNKFTF